MFAQMCEAVAACHDASVFHRDIKPENFIVAEGGAFNHDGICGGEVTVKLLGFGLSTRDAVSSEMDCGSPPYMSYECRNNVAPVYKPRGADIWSLGMILINMLYHCNPWSDTIRVGFSSFDEYLSNPVGFFMTRFIGMTLPVAKFLVGNVFCILDDPTDDSQRIDAREFGIWVRDLPVLMAASQPESHTHVPSTMSVSTTHSLASAPASHHPSVRPSLTRNTLVDSALDYNPYDDLVSPALNVVPEEGENGEWQQQPRGRVGHHEPDVARSPSHSEWSSNGATRSASPTSKPVTNAFQMFAREIKHPTRPRALIRTFGSPASGSHALDVVPPYDPDFFEGCESLPSTSRALAHEVGGLTRPTATKRTNKQNLAFGKGQGGNVATRSTRSGWRISNLHSDSARPTRVSNMITELGSSPPQPKKRPQLSNYQRTRKDKFSVFRPVRDLTNSDDDTDVRNDSGDDNCEDEFFDVDSGSYNGPRSTKTMSKRSFSTGSFVTRSVVSVDSSNVSVY